jgi:hypothetical protein
MEGAQIAIYILNGVIILITAYLIFLYIKSDTFRIYPCYNILIISFIVFYDNIIRLLPLRFIKAIKIFAAFKYTQAFLLTFMDKLLLSTITCQVVITYLGVCHTRFYFDSEKKIFVSTLLIGVVISIIISLVYIILPGKLANYGDYFYCFDFGYKKKIIDIIFNGLFLLITLALTLLLLGYIGTKKKEVSLGLIEDLDYGHHFTKILIMFIVNSLLFIESFLIIFDAFPVSNVDLFYLGLCLIILLYYTINRKVIEETMKIFCYNYYKKNYANKKKTSSTSITEDDEEEEEENRTESF